MVALPWLVFGAIAAVAGLRVSLAAEDEFERSMRLRGIDPEDVAHSSRTSAIRRNRIVGGLFVLVGVGLLAWGLLG